MIEVSSWSRQLIYEKMVRKFAKVELASGKIFRAGTQNFQKKQMKHNNIGFNEGYGHEKLGRSKLK